MIKMQPRPRLLLSGSELWGSELIPARYQDPRRDVVGPGHFALWGSGELALDVLAQSDRELWCEVLRRWLLLLESLADATFMREMEDGDIPRGAFRAREAPEGDVPERLREVWADAEEALRDLQARWAMATGWERLNASYEVRGVFRAAGYLNEGAATLLLKLPELPVTVERR